jgi:ankyrin repeat protein
MPVAYIHTLLRNHCFYDVADLVRRDQASAVALNSAKTSPLGVLITLLTRGTVQMAIDQDSREYADGFQDAFEALLDACPRAVAHVDKYGDTPLIIACRDGHVARLELMIQQSIHADMLRWVIERMIDVCPISVKVADCFGELPLFHVTDMGGGPLDIIKRLIRAYPDSLLRDGRKNLILDMVESGPVMYWDRLKPILALCPAAALVRPKHSVNPIHRLWLTVYSHQKLDIDQVALMMTTGQDEFYLKAKDLLLLLLKAGYHNTTSDELPGNVPFRALHAAAGLKVPNELISLLIRLFPGQLREVDEEHGWTPLHVEAAGPHKSRDKIDSPTGLEMLAQAYPDAARVLDRNGKLPLHLALEHDKTWKFGVKELVEAEPLALRIAVGYSGMYPFELAASGRRADINTVYELLRANSAVIRLARGQL